jgi:hypothetical protein
MAEGKRTYEHGEAEGQANPEQPDSNLNVVLAEEFAGDDYAAAASEHQQERPQELCA